MFNMPIVRIEIEGMKQQIAAALTDYGNEIKESVDREIERAIAEYPFRETVRRHAAEAINQSIKSAIDKYFKYGVGATAIEASINEILSGVSDLSEE